LLRGRRVPRSEAEWGGAGGEGATSPPDKNYPYQMAALSPPSLAGKGAGGVRLAPLLPHLFLRQTDKLVQRLRFQVLARAQPDGYGSHFGLLGADDQHIWDLLKLGVADLGLHPVAALVHFYPEVLGLELVGHLAGVVQVLVRDRDDH